MILGRKVLAQTESLEGVLIVILRDPSLSRCFLSYPLLARSFPAAFLFQNIKLRMRQSTYKTSMSTTSYSCGSSYV